MLQVHRVLLPSPIEEGDGILTDATWSLNKNDEPVVDNLKVYFILDGNVGKDVSNEIELTIYLWLARKVLEEIETFILNGSEY
jgi:hypothetical protein